ncbi:TetR/AcrR family transcriptional regulator [Mycobacterium sp.]|uniref:TetR/AcrR family transcriptional regulator n=1 Tax=Mycobacterium sp. TaxID=1785 RepID=UPI003BAB2369
MTTSAAQPLVPSHGDRARILDAAEVCLRDKGIRGTTMAAVAAAAGVSRAWLYRLYQDKTQLFGVVMVRMDRTYWESEGARVRAALTLVDTVVEAVLLARKMQHRPLIDKLRETEPDAFAAVTEIGMQHYIPWLSATWRRYAEAAQERGEVRLDLPLDWAAEWLARLVLSLCTMPSEVVDVDDREQLRSYVSEFLLPGLGQRQPDPQRPS